MFKINYKAVSKDYQVVTNSYCITNCAASKQNPSAVGHDQLESGQ